MHLLDILDLVLFIFGLNDSGAAAGWKGKVQRWFWKRVSESWPATQSALLSGHIQKLQGYYLLSMPYSFYAAGDRYGGRFEHEFATESRAQDALQRLRASAPQVRYKPNHPDRSVLVIGNWEAR